MTIINGGLINCGGAASSSSTLALSDGLACFTGSFSGVTTTSISHNLNSSALVVEFKDSLGNLLIPDTWSITNPNVIEADFSPAATGDVTIIACIESGLAPITGGVTSVEGLSGVIDLDSPNNSIVITTSGQVINLNAIFTPASGAVLEQKCRDITILSGLIGTGGGGGVASINNISGIVTLTSTNNGLEVGVNGQSIEFTTLFTYTSGQIIDQHTQDLLELSGVATQNTADIVSLSGTVDGVDERLIALSGLTDGLPRTQTSINGLSGAILLDSPDNTILIGNNGQTIELSGLFTQASGAVLEQKCLDIDSVSGVAYSNSGILEQRINERRWQGAISGLELSINSGNSGLYDVAAGVAYISGIRIVVPEQIGVDPQFLPGSGTGCGLQVAFIGLNVDGSLDSSIDAIHTHDDQATLIDLGLLTAWDPASPNSGLIQLAHTERQDVLNVDYNRISWVEFAVGAVVSSGIIVSDNGSLTLAASDGVFYDRHQNRHLHEQDIPLDFFEIYRGSDGVYRVQAETTLVNNTQYDDGTGLTALTGNRWASHSLWFDVVRDLHFMVISNDQYSSLQLAQDAPLNPGCIVDFANVIPIAQVVIQRNKTVIGGDTGRIIDRRPIIGARDAGGVLSTSATSLQQAYENSLASAEIILQEEQGGLTIADNATPLVNTGTHLFEVHNSDETVEYFQVNGSGIYAPSGIFEHKVGIGGAFPQGAEARCTLDVSGMICTSGLEIVGSRPTLSGVGMATLADIIDTQMTLNGLSGAVTLTSPDDSILIGSNGQAIEISGLFTPASGATLQQKCEDVLTLSGTVIQNTADINGVNTRLISLSGLTDGLPRTQTSVNGLSGVLLLDSPDGTILIGQDGQTIELSGLFTQASGAILEQHVQDLVDLSGLIMGDGGQTSVNGLSGIISISGVNLEVTTSGQTILVSGIMNAASGAIIEQKCRDIDTLSGLILADGGQTSIDGLSGVLLLDSPDGTILIGQDGQTIELSGLFTQASGAVLEQHTTDLVTLSGLIGAGGGGGGTSINGISGVVTLTSPDESVGIAVNGQSIELTVDTSGACSVHTFAPSDGTIFTVTHGLNTEDFVWNMWRTDEEPNATTIGNVASSGLNHAIVQLAAPISGKLVIQGCASSGTRADIIATKTITDHYNASTIDSAIFADASLANITVTLHNPSGFDGKSMYVKMIATSGTAVTLNANGSGLIDNDNTAEIDQIYHAVRVTAHDGNWWIL